VGDRSSDPVVSRLGALHQRSTAVLKSVTTAKMPAWLLLASLVFGQAAPPAGASSSSPTAVDRAFQRLYSFDFPGTFAALDDHARAEPQNPLTFSVRAGAYLFKELDRLRILEIQFFLNDDNAVDGTAKAKPDPEVRARLFEALGEARRRATARLAANPDDVDALFAMCMASQIEIDWMGLVERRTWRTLRLAHNMTLYGDRLLARKPPFYDAYVNFGVLEYAVGSLPFFIRWFVHYDGVEGSKSRGIEHLKLAAQHGRYYGPFARILLAVASVREGKLEEAEKLLAGLSQDFPENPLFKKELARVRDAMRRKRAR
jgi:hypothetical protein